MPPAAAPAAGAAGAGNAQGGQQQQQQRGGGLMAGIFRAIMMWCVFRASRLPGARPHALHLPCCATP